jgi:hypothetical protein
MLRAVLEILYAGLSRNPFLAAHAIEANEVLLKEFSIAAFSLLIAISFLHIDD